MKDRSTRLDCLLIGHNEIPFKQYEGFLRELGEDREVYRDLRYNFIDVVGEGKMHYLDLLNHVWTKARGNADPSDAGPFRLGDVPHLASVYLTNFLNRRGKRADWINLFESEQERLIERLAENPRCVGITTTLYVFNEPAKRVVDFVRGHHETVPIVIGGPLIANLARAHEGVELEWHLRNLGADIFVVESQGESTLDRIVQCLIDGGDLGSIPNLLYFDDQGKLHRTDVEAESNDLDEEFISWASFPEHDLGGTIQTRTARSCSFNCAFCNYPTRGGKLALADLETVKKELDSMRELGNVKNVMFIDDTFNVPLPRFKKLCELMIREDYGFEWYSYFRCSNSDLECVDLMAEAGCKGAFLGMESGSPSVLAKMNKFATIEKYHEGARWLHSRGIMTFGSFIVGFPGETEETVGETIDFINSSQIDLFRAQLWYCEPGTPVYQQRESVGLEGSGYSWHHDTMDSSFAMEQVERIFWSVTESEWLPKHSFGFWLIPYLAGKGIPFSQFKEWLRHANEMLRMELNRTPQEEKGVVQAGHLSQMVELFR